MTNHDMIAKAMVAHRGKTLSTEDIGDLTKRMFPAFAEGSNRPNDHAGGNKSDCTCARTSRRIFDRVDWGVYRVR
jgi:hypothetical protein